MVKIKKTPYYSYLIGKLAEGCKLCVQGRKSVMYITGLCLRRCYYCPLSDDKRYKDVICINEEKIKDTEKGIRTLLEEIKISKSKGVGITGGDPLLRLHRTVRYIRLFKKTFGKKFHIHLYTSLNLISAKILKKLYEAGLDEIRFHLDLENKKLWPRLSMTKKYNWKVGVEIPAIPDKYERIIELVEFIKDKVDFLNINELEYSDTNSQFLSQRKFYTKNFMSYAIKGSEKTAKKVLRYIEKKNIKLNTHYCTAKLKDAVQLQKRIELRSKSIKKEYDQRTADGMLIRGVIYLKGLEPGFSYKQRLKKANKTRALKKLETTLMKLKAKYNIPGKLMEIDTKLMRILTTPVIASRLKKEIKKMGCVPCIIEEHPTADNLIVTLQKL